MVRHHSPWTDLTFSSDFSLPHRERVQTGIDLGIKRITKQRGVRRAGAVRHRVLIGAVERFWRERQPAIDIK